MLGDETKVGVQLLILVYSTVITLDLYINNYFQQSLKICNTQLLARATIV